MKKRSAGDRLILIVFAAIITLSLTQCERRRQAGKRVQSRGRPGKSKPRMGCFAGQEFENWMSHYVVRGWYFMRLNEFERALQDFTRVADLVERQGRQKSVHRGRIEGLAGMVALFAGGYQPGNFTAL